MATIALFEIILQKNIGSNFYFLRRIYIFKITQL